MPDIYSPSPSEPSPELLAGYVLGDLNQAEVDRVEAYLLEHPERRAEIASLTLPLVQPPDSLRAQILPAASPDSLAIMPITQPPQKSRQWWKPIAASIELALIAYFG